MEYGHVRGFQHVDDVTPAHRTARVAAVRVQDEDLAAVLILRAVHVDADRVVERRPAVRPSHPDPLDQTRQLRLGIARDPDLGIEIDERHVFSMRQLVDELHGRRPRQLDVLSHAAAGVKQQADVKREGRIALSPSVK